jgi:hypothetical protein
MSDKSKKHNKHSKNEKHSQEKKHPSSEKMSKKDLGKIHGGAAMDAQIFSSEPDGKAKRF